MKRTSLFGSLRHPRPIARQFCSLGWWPFGLGPPKAMDLPAGNWSLAYAVYSGPGNKTKLNTHKLSPAMALLLYFTSFFLKHFQECEADGTDVPYGHLKTLDCRPCPRVSCACIEQEDDRLKLAFLIWVSNCWKESLKRSLLLRNHLGQKAKLIPLAPSSFCSSQINISAVAHSGCAGNTWLGESQL